MLMNLQSCQNFQMPAAPDLSNQSTEKPLEPLRTLITDSTPELIHVQYGGKGLDNGHRTEEYYLRHQPSQHEYAVRGVHYIPYDGTLKSYDINFNLPEKLVQTALQSAFAADWSNLTESEISFLAESHYPSYALTIVLSGKRIFSLFSVSNAVSKQPWNLAIDKTHYKSINKDLDTGLINLLIQIRRTTLT